MSWLDKVKSMFATPAPADDAPKMDVPQHALLIDIGLSDAAFGTPEEREAVFELEDGLIEAMSVEPSIEVDGHEFGEGIGRVYVYGPDADRMFALAEPSLRAFAAPKKKITRRYGPPGDPDVRSVETVLG